MIAAVGLIMALVLFFCHKGRKLAANDGFTSYKQRMQLDEGRRMYEVLSKAGEDASEYAKYAKKLTPKKQAKLLKKMNQ